ncbi:hypothetical protein P4361_09425 [Fictibacillus sp. B-59209]|uniref:hypothetical protein n=1 Tax=Fictibacillus sp. B-59209 TaxID=3024873 RepID=UPI002E211B0A|nr:hypothetical protein [Fictibacillus sp. B-59209]
MKMAFLFKSSIPGASGTLFFALKEARGRGTLYFALKEARGRGTLYFALKEARGTGTFIFMNMTTFFHNFTTFLFKASILY